MAGVGTEDLPLLLGTLTWLACGVWTAGPGWRIQRGHLSAAGETPFPRLALTWWVLLIGAVALVVCHPLAGVAGIVTVAMAGTVSVLVDARTHRLPDGCTLTMACGALVGLVSRLLVDGDARVLPGLLVGVAVWTLPLAAGHLARAGVGLGDVKLAPVLGAVLGTISWEAAVGGLVLAFLGAGTAALWLLVSGGGGLRSRIAMGPWLIGAALVAVVLWGVLPVQVGGGAG
ncbi:prepilin peptidase [Actinomyces polynesiensis]|uniref:prepilin peptidase n=1 Tax=Actinomyces polynesiensis TaxID=1325934 RepID=UPI0005B85B44|nr:A24 family peptidase [Actinomyces polynesiensis]